MSPRCDRVGIPFTTRHGRSSPSLFAMESQSRNSIRPNVRRKLQGDRNRTLLRNIVYAGGWAALLEIDMDLVGEMIIEKFSRKEAARANNTADQTRIPITRRETTTPVPFHLEKMNATGDSIIIDGNTAADSVLWYAGLRSAHVPDYASTSLMKHSKDFARKFPQRS